MMEGQSKSSIAPLFQSQVIMREGHGKSSIAQLFFKMGLLAFHDQSPRKNVADPAGVEHATS